MWPHHKTAGKSKVKNDILWQSTARIPTASDCKILTQELDNQPTSHASGRIPSLLANLLRFHDEKAGAVSVLIVKHRWIWRVSSSQKGTCKTPKGVCQKLALLKKTHQNIKGSFQCCINVDFFSRDFAEFFTLRHPHIPTFEILSPHESPEPSSASALHGWDHERNEPPRNMSFLDGTQGSRGHIGARLRRLIQTVEKIANSLLHCENGSTCHQCQCPSVFKCGATRWSRSAAAQPQWCRNRNNRNNQKKHQWRYVP